MISICCLVIKATNVWYDTTQTFTRRTMSRCQHGDNGRSASNCVKRWVFLRCSLHYYRSYFIQTVPSNRKRAVDFVFLRYLYSSVPRRRLMIQAHSRSRWRLPGETVTSSTASWLTSHVAPSAQRSRRRFSRCRHVTVLQTTWRVRAVSAVTSCWATSPRQLATSPRRMTSRLSGVAIVTPYNWTSSQLRSCSRQAVAQSTRNMKLTVSA